MNQQLQLCQVFNQKQSTAIILMYVVLYATKHKHIDNSKCQTQSVSKNHQQDLTAGNIY